jgi:hypothetical protein
MQTASESHESRRIHRAKPRVQGSAGRVFPSPQLLCGLRWDLAGLWTSREARAAALKFPGRRQFRLLGSLLPQQTCLSPILNTNGRGRASRTLRLLPSKTSRKCHDCSVQCRPMFVDLAVQPRRKGEFCESCGQIFSGCAANFSVPSLHCLYCCIPPPLLPVSSPHFHPTLRLLVPAKPCPISRCPLPPPLPSL